VTILSWEKIQKQTIKVFNIQKNDDRCYLSLKHFIIRHNDKSLISASSREIFNHFTSTTPNDRNV